jgi:hypothetical protein
LGTLSIAPHPLEDTPWIQVGYFNIVLEFSTFSVNSKHSLRVFIARTIVQFVSDVFSTASSMIIQYLYRTVDIPDGKPYRTVTHFGM